MWSLQVLFVHMIVSKHKVCLLTLWCNLVYIIYLSEIVFLDVKYCIKVLDVKVSLGESLTPKGIIYKNHKTLFLAGGNL